MISAIHKADWKAVKALLFDFDGVIVESVDIKTQAFAKLFEDYGEDVVKKVTAHHVLHGGISRFEKIKFYHKAYVGREIDTGELGIWCKRFSDIVLDSVIKAPLVPGVLDFFKKTSGKFSCFIVSGTPQEELELILEKRALSRYFRKAYGSPSSKKEIIGNIISSDALHPDEMIYYGDSLSDYDASVATGVYFIGRVPKDTNNPFPMNTETIKDFTTYLENFETGSS